MAVKRSRPVKQVANATAHHVTLKVDVAVVTWAKNGRDLMLAFQTKMIVFNTDDDVRHEHVIETAADEIARILARAGLADSRTEIDRFNAGRRVTARHIGHPIGKRQTNTGPDEEDIVNPVDVAGEGRIRAGRATFESAEEVLRFHAKDDVVPLVLVTDLATANPAV